MGSKTFKRIGTAVVTGGTSEVLRASRKPLRSVSKSVGKVVGDVVTPLTEAILPQPPPPPVPEALAPPPPPEPEPEPSAPTPEEATVSNATAFRETQALNEQRKRKGRRASILTRRRFGQLGTASEQTLG